MWSAETEAHLFGWAAARSLHVGGDFVLAGGVEDARLTEISRGAFEAAFLAGAQPFARHRLAEQQRVSLFAHKELAQPAAGVRFIGALVMITAPVIEIGRGMLRVHAHVGKVADG